MHESTAFACPMLSLRAPVSVPGGPCCAAAGGAPHLPHQHAHPNRRLLLLLHSAAFSVLPALYAPPAPASTSRGTTFYSDWPYQRPGDILPFIQSGAPRGDADAVLRAIDEFAENYPMFRSGKEKGTLLEAEVRIAAPALALEFGTFMAYGTIRIARQLPPGGRLISLEASEEQADVARAILDWAGLAEGQVSVVTGLASDTLPRLAPELGSSRQAGLVFLDHCKQCYLPDLELAERLGIVGPGTVVVADNVIVPGAPGYLEHVTGPASPLDEVAATGSGARSGAAREEERAARDACRWRTRLVEAAFEVEEKYKPGWAPQRDAMAISVCTAP